MSSSVLTKSPRPAAPLPPIRRMSSMPSISGASAGRRDHDVDGTADVRERHERGPPDQASTTFAIPILSSVRATRKRWSASSSTTNSARFLERNRGLVGDELDHGASAAAGRCGGRRQSATEHVYAHGREPRASEGFATDSSRPASPSHALPPRRSQRLISRPRGRTWSDAGQLARRLRGILAPIPPDARARVSGDSRPDSAARPRRVSLAKSGMIGRTCRVRSTRGRRLSDTRQRGAEMRHSADGRPMQESRPLTPGSAPRFARLDDTGRRRHVRGGRRAPGDSGRVRCATRSQDRCRTR